MESYRDEQGRPRHRVLLALGSAETVEGALVNALADVTEAHNSAAKFRARASARWIEWMEQAVPGSRASARLWASAEADERSATGWSARAAKHEARVALIREHLPAGEPDDLASRVAATVASRREARAALYARIAEKLQTLAQTT